MSFKRLIVFVFVSFWFLGSFAVMAQKLDTSIGTIQSPLGDTDMFGLIEKIVSYIRPIIAIAFLFVIIYGGYTRMTAAGDPEKEKKSNSILTAGVVGFVIIVLAPAVVRLVSSLIGIQGDVV